MSSNSNKSGEQESDNPKSGATGATLVSPPHDNNFLNRNSSVSTGGTVYSMKLQPQPELSSDTTYPAAVTQADLRVCSQLFHIQQGVGICTGQVGFRLQPLSSQRASDLLTEFKSTPKAAMTSESVPFHFVVHKVTKYEGGPDVDNLALLQPTDKNKEQYYLSPATIQDAEAYFEMVTFTAQNIPEAPKDLDMHEPTHLVAWACHLETLEHQALIYQRLVAYHEDRLEKNIEHPFPPQIQNSTYWTGDDDEIKELSESEIQYRISLLKQQMSAVRLSPVKGADRSKVAAMALAGKKALLRFSSINLKGATTQDMKDISKNIDDMSAKYGSLFFAPPVETEPSTIFSGQDIVLCLGYGMNLQTNLEKAEGVGMGDRVFYAANLLTLLGTEKDLKPWKQDSNSTKWIQQKYLKILGLIAPNWLKTTPIQNVSNYQGILGKLVISVYYVLKVYLMQLQAETREEWIKREVPLGFRDQFIKQMDNIVGWKTPEKLWDYDSKLLARSCTCILSHWVMLLTHSLKANPSNIDLLRDHWINNCSGLGDGTAEDTELKMLQLTIFIVQKYVLPMLGIMENWKTGWKKVLEKERWQEKSRWVWYCKHAQMYNELTGLYREALDEHGKSDGTSRITAIMMEMAKKMQKKQIRGECPVDSDENLGKYDGATADRRLYPEMELDQFTVEYVMVKRNGRGHKNKFVNPKTLPDIVVECEQHLKQLDAGQKIGSEDEEDEEDRMSQWPNFLECNLQNQVFEIPEEEVLPDGLLGDKRKDRDDSDELNSEGGGNKDNGKGGGRKKRKTKKAEDFKDIPNSLRPIFPLLAQHLEDAGEEWRERLGEATGFATSKTQHSRRVGALSALGTPTKEGKVDTEKDKEGGHGDE